jgi:hypothetical protein
MNKILLTFLLFVVFSCKNDNQNSNAVKSNIINQKNKSSLINQLITHSEWHLENSVPQTLGKSCTDEEYLSFQKDSVTHSFCKNGELQTTKEAWSILDESKLIMAGQEYLITVSGNILMINKVNGQKDEDSSGKKFIGESNE